MFESALEKPFLYLLVLSVLLHLLAFKLLDRIPADKKNPPVATMVDLTDLPAQPSPERKQAAPEKPELPKAKPAPKRLAAPPLPVAPLPRVMPRVVPRPAPKVPQPSILGKEPALPAKTVPPLPATSDALPRTTPKPAAEPLRGEGLFKPQRGSHKELARLFPSAGKMEKMDEGFRAKFLEEERGDTRLMDTDDPSIGTFTRRFRAALLSRLIAIDRTDKKGLGITVVKINFKRDGTIGPVTLVYSTGNTAVDELAIKASRTAGYVGPLPRRWEHDELNMVVSFVVQEGYVATGWHWE